MSIGETVLANEQDEYFVKNAGFERSFNLNYTNHMMWTRKRRRSCAAG